MTTNGERAALRCPTCGSYNIEQHDPRPGEHTCRDCGEWIDDEDAPMHTPDSASGAADPCTCVEGLIGLCAACMNPSHSASYVEDKQ